MLLRALALVAPPACPACATALGGTHDRLCAVCAASVPWITEPCSRCALPRPCGRCPDRRASWDRAWAPAAHAGPARGLVLALKSRGSRGAASVMAAQIAAQAPRDVLAPGAVLVPVPMDPRRRRRRGFDHADLLARALASRTGAHVWSCLRRAPGGERQVGSGRRARTAAGRHALTAKGPLSGGFVVVDDVHTTGATLEACARALKGAGAEVVHVLTYTRTLR